MTDASEKLGKFWQKIGSDLQKSEPGSDQHDRACFVIAEYVRKNPHRIKRRPLPKRPAMIGDDDEILDALEKSKRNAESGRRINFFATWRAAVIRIEGMNASTIYLTLSSLRTYERLGIDDAAAEVRTLLNDEFGWDDVSPTDLAQLRSQAGKWSEDHETLSVELRYGHRIREEKSADDPEDDFSFMGDVL